MFGYPKKTLLGLAVVGLVMLITPRAFAAALVSDQEIAADAARYQALGAVYSPGGFPEFPGRETPFYGRPGYGKYRLTQIRLRGGLIYQDADGTAIAHNFSCGRFETIYVELYLPGGPETGGMIAFAWQDPGLTCRTGGQPGGEDPLYLDITGDGKPEIRFSSIDRISSYLIEADLRRRVFKEEILPTWVKKAAGRESQAAREGVRPGPLWVEPYFEDRLGGER